MKSQAETIAELNARCGGPNQFENFDRAFRKSLTRRCTPSFRATPRTVPTPNSYSRRISSYRSTLALQSNPVLRLGGDLKQSTWFLFL